MSERMCSKCALMPASVTAPWTEAERDAAAQAIERHFYDGSSTEDYYDDDSGDEDRAIAAAVLDVVAPMIAERAIKQAADAAADNCARALNDDDPTEANRWADTEHWLRARAGGGGR